MARPDLKLIIIADEPQIIKESSENAHMSSEADAALLRENMANLGAIFSCAKSPRDITSEDLRVVERALREDVFNGIKAFPDDLLQDFFALPGPAVDTMPEVIAQINCAIESAEELEGLRALCRSHEAKLGRNCDAPSAEAAIIYSVYREISKDIGVKSRSLYASYICIDELMSYIGDCLQPPLED